VPIIKKCLYVDDCLMSVDSPDNAIRLAKELKLLLQSGDFQLKFISSKRTVLSTINEDDLAPAMKDLDVGGLPVTKALGVAQNTQNDSLEILVDLKQRPVTRRGIFALLWRKRVH